MRGVSLAQPNLSQISGVVSVKDQGAKGNNSHLEDSAFLAGIEKCLGTADPVTNTRIATRALYIPSGQYLISPDVFKVLSAQGLHVFGDGPWTTQLNINTPVGGGGAGLLFDGMAQSLIENFGIANVGGAGICDRLIDLRWSGSSVTHRSTTGNTFRNVSVQNGGAGWRSGVAIGINDGTLQNDGNSFIDCIVTGGRTVGSGTTTTYQFGYEVGSGVAGNCLNHLFLKFNVGGVRYGIHANRANFMAYGGQPASCDQIFRIVPMGQNIVIGGMNAESAQQFIWYSNSTSASSPITIESCIFRMNLLGADHRAMYLHDHGPITLRDITLITSPNGVTPTIAANWQLVFDGVRMPTALASVVSADDGDGPAGGSPPPILAGEGYTQVDNVFATVTRNWPGFGTVRKGALAPDTTDIPAGMSWDWHNTGDGTTKRYYNDAGTLKSVAFA